VLTLHPSVRIYVCTAPTDMRRGFDGLAQMAQDIVRQDPLSGHFFVFLNRRRDRVKILYWDHDGYAVWAKRLEAGTFRLPAATGPHLELRHAELAMLLGGIDPAGSRRRVRFSLPSPDPVSTGPVGS
jgi:transposase